MGVCNGATHTHTHWKERGRGVGVEKQSSSRGRERGEESRQRGIACGRLVTREGAHESRCCWWALNCAPVDKEEQRRDRRRRRREEEGGQDEGFGRVGRTGGLEEERSSRDPSQSLAQEWAASHWTRWIALHLCNDGKTQSTTQDDNMQRHKKKKKCLSWSPVSLSSFHALSVGQPETLCSWPC